VTGYCGAEQVACGESVEWVDPVCIIFSTITLQNAAAKLKKNNSQL